MMYSPETVVLVVDDMLTMRKLVKKACQGLGFTNFVEAKDGQEAWAAMCEANPAVGLVISDWNMPNCSGLEFLKRVRASEQYKEMPFVLLTAESEAAQVQEAVLAGVDNYIVKPFTEAILREKLEVVYKKKPA
jgi:two-component system chemotaxis response regulator CheY